MSCIQPIAIPNTNPYIPVKYLSVPCGKCYNCLSSLRNQWTFRLRQQLKSSQLSLFVTLTYNEASIPFIENYPRVGIRTMCFDYATVQKSLKSIRKMLTPTRFSYLAISEYGSLGARPHYHFAIFSRGPATLDDYKKAFQKYWQYGNTVVDSLTDARIHYITQHQLRLDGTASQWKDIAQNNPEVFDKIYPRRYFSKGLGKNFLSHASNYVGPQKNILYLDGLPLGLPRYYRKKLYSHVSQKEKASVYQEQSYRDKLNYLRSLDKLSRALPSYFTTSKVHEILMENLQIQSTLSFEKLKKKHRDPYETLNTQQKYGKH